MLLINLKNNIKFNYQDNISLNKIFNNNLFLQMIEYVSNIRFLFSNKREDSFKGYKAYSLLFIQPYNHPC